MSGNSDEASLSPSAGAQHSGPRFVFEIHRSDEDIGKFYWTFHNTNGDTAVVATSALYPDKQSCRYGIHQLMRFADRARLVDTDSNPFAQT